MTTTQLFHYLRPSAVGPDGRVALQTSGGATASGLAHPRFFAGFVGEAECAAAGLLAVANVAQARYWRRDLARLRDPVVTCNDDRLRFESFSGCCGVYARLDVTGENLDAAILDHGTTNVDVNDPLRAALARVRGGDPLHLAVGPEDVEVATFDGEVVERKVNLPGRWLRGFAEVQALTSGYDLRMEVSGPDAARFLRTLPSTMGRVLWVVAAGRTLRTTARPAPGAVCLAGAPRLRELLPLLRFGTTLRVYGPVLRRDSPPTASVWQLDLPGMRLTLALSPEAARGFSGEGAVLSALIRDEVMDDAEVVGALLRHDARIDVGRLADEAGLAPARVRTALTWLGTAGRVGYDHADAAFFHRDLPYDAEVALRDNPRLRGARELVAAGAVAWDGPVAVIRLADHEHRVRDDGSGRMSCTCVWWTAHTGGRGPCRHILAAEQARRAERDRTEASGLAEVPARTAEVAGR